MISRLATSGHHSWWRSARRPPIRVTTLAALIALSVPLFGGAAAAVEENPDVDTAAVYEYVADPETNSVNITIKVTADKPNRNTATGTYQYYFEGHGITLPIEARDLAITDGSGRPLDYEIDYEDDRFQGVIYSFRRNIFYRQTATVVINYSLVEDRDNEFSLVRVNDAYIGVEVWTDPFLETAEVIVRAPLGFEDHTQFDFDGANFDVEYVDDEVHFTTDEVDPEDFWRVVSLKRSTQLVDVPLEVEGHEIVLQAWPGDKTWSVDASESIETGLPLLLEAVGLEWPLDNTLTVTESFDPTLAGYGGWYDSTFREISVGDQVDDHLMMHELSHLWFGRELFTDRWITEGLANIYAAEVVEQMGQERPEPDNVLLFDASSIPLSEWSSLDRRPETEEWAYPASWHVTNAIVAEIGREVLDAVVEAADGDEISYHGDVDPEEFTGDADWMWYLDLLENEVRDGNDELRELFRDWVVSVADITNLEARNQHRDRYLELEDQGGEWAPPVGLRQSMATWEFPEAAEAIESAESVLDRRDEMVVLLSTVGAQLPDDLEASYEAAVDAAMVESTELFDEAEPAAQDLSSTNQALEDATGVFQKIGLLGDDHQSDLAQAVDSFQDGDFEAVGDQTATLDGDIDALARAGMIRSSVAAGGVLLLLVGLWFVWFARRRPPLELGDAAQ